MARNGTGQDDACLGRVVRRLRVQQQISQSMLGERLDLSYQQVQKYEAGSNRVAFGMFLRIAAALGIPAQELLRQTEREIAAVTRS